MLFLVLYTIQGGQVEQEESKVVLDLKNMELTQAVSLCRAVKDSVYAVKIHDLYDKYGRWACSVLYNAGAPRVWVDYKLHDMPDTVVARLRQLIGAGAAIVTVHAAGGENMMRAAVQSDYGTEIYAVTELTSLSNEDIMAKYHMTRAELVLLRARWARSAGVTGVVCSAHETRLLRDDFETGSLKLVVPGTRSPGAAKHDQKMVATPAQAVRDGANLLVIGRQVTNAPDPLAELERIEYEISTA